MAMAALATSAGLKLADIPVKNWQQQKQHEMTGLHTIWIEHLSQYSVVGTYLICRLQSVFERSSHHLQSPLLRPCNIRTRSPLVAGVGKDIVWNSRIDTQAIRGTGRSVLLGLFMLPTCQLDALRKGRRHDFESEGQIISRAKREKHFLVLPPRFWHFGEPIIFSIMGIVGKQNYICSFIRYILCYYKLHVHVQCYASQ